MKIDAYSFFMALAITSVFAPTFFVLQRSGWSRAKIYGFLLTCLLLVLVSAKYFGSLGLFLSIGIWQLGPASVMGMLVVAVFLARTWALTHGEPGRAVLKLWSYLLPAAQAIGRIGCWSAGCCFIRAPYTFPWPVLEGAGCLLIAAALFAQRNRLRPLTLFTIYLWSYLILRFLLEFLRGDRIRGHINGLSLPQWICLVLICWLFLDYRRLRYHNKSHEIRGRELR